MRYIKVLLLVLLIFFSLVFFFQNQTALSTAMTLKLNLFFVPEMTSIPLPFYFIVIVAFFVGALLAVALRAAISSARSPRKRPRPSKPLPPRRRPRPSRKK